MVLAPRSKFRRGFNSPFPVPTQMKESFSVVHALCRNYTYAFIYVCVHVTLLMLCAFDTCLVE